MQLDGKGRMLCEWAKLKQVAGRGYGGDSGSSWG